MADRRCGTCEHFRGEYERCACPDPLMAARALRTSDGGQWCQWHEREEQ